MGPEFIDDEPRTRGISARLSAVTHHLQQIAVGIEEIDAVVIAPIDRRRALDPGRRQPLPSVGKIAPRHPERMMSAAERVRDYRLARGGAQPGPGHLEQRKVLAAAIEQNLIAKTVDDFKPEDTGIKALRPREVRHLDTKMIQPLKFHCAHRIRLSTRADD